MIVVGLDGKEYKWKYNQYLSQKDNASNLHVEARAVVKSIYPLSIIAEEIPLVGTLGEYLIIDMYVHTQRLVIEVQGEQHYKFNSFYFNSKKDYIKAQNRDKSKIEWCKLNNLDYVALPFNKKKEWEEMIRGRNG